MEATAETYGFSLADALGLTADEVTAFLATAGPLDPVRAARFLLNEVPKWVDVNRLDPKVIAAMLLIRPACNGREWRAVMGFIFEGARGTVL